VQGRLVGLCLQVDRIVASAFKSPVVLKLKQANLSILEQFGGLGICPTRLARA